VLRTALIRGAFEYQGQKCSAASRAYLPASLWKRLRDELIAAVDALPMGDVTDFSTFMGALIDAPSYTRIVHAIQRAETDPTISVIAGGSYDDSVGYFVRPTVLVGTDPSHEVFTTEYFGPILSVYVYDADFLPVLRQLDSVSSYALTGSIIARDRAAIAIAIATATSELRFAAGNFSINDKPSGAVVGQQPFGGGRASGTNDKAGAALNLRRWVSPRSIKENRCHRSTTTTRI